MSLPTSPNRTSVITLRSGATGWPVFALQRGLDQLGYSCYADGEFGPGTEGVVRAFQLRQALVADGLAGPTTQAQIVRLSDNATHDIYPELPTGLIRGFATAESGNLLGAVNWQIVGGVDCGVVQIRCIGPPFSQSALRLAYDPIMAMGRVAASFLDQTVAFSQQAYSKAQPLEWAMRCAALSWNWPWAANQYAIAGKLPNPSRDATWAVVNGQRIKFPDGAPVLTYDDWARFYALGGRHGEGRVTRFVTKWALR